MTPAAAEAAGRILGPTDARATGQDWVYPTLPGPPEDDPQLRAALGFAGGVTEPPVHFDEPDDGFGKVVDMKGWQRGHDKGGTPLT